MTNCTENEGKQVSKEYEGILSIEEQCGFSPAASIEPQVSVAHGNEPEQAPHGEANPCGGWPSEEEIARVIKSGLEEPLSERVEPTDDEYLTVARAVLSSLPHPPSEDGSDISASKPQSHAPQEPVAQSSEPPEFFHGRALFGMPVRFDAALSPDVVEFRHADGRVNRFRIGVPHSKTLQDEMPSEIK